MTHTVHLMWKEYRALRAFWLALALFGLACDGLIVIFVDSPQGRLAGMFSFAGVLPAGFALGAGAILFALEREEATHDFLRCLPVTSPRVFTGKVVTAVCGTLLLAVVLVAVTLYEVREISSRPSVIFGGADLALVYALMVVQALGWSVFFSLQSARPLLAALLGSLGAVSCISLVHFATERLSLARLHGTWDSPVLHLMATLAVWSADVWLGSRWLQGRRGVEQSRFMGTGRLIAYKRLLWQAWRGSYRVLLTILVLGVLLPIVLWGAFIPFTVLGFALLGAATFLADQESRQFRFFAERGISPRRLWLSRQMFWGGAAIALALVLAVAGRLVFIFVFEQPSPSEARRIWDAMSWVLDPLNYLIWIGLAFAAGQLCSMFFQSGVLAATLGVVLAGVLAGWATIMHQLDIGLWWSAAPLFVALIAATWLRSTGWLLERHTWRTWAPALLVPAITIVALLVSVPAYRVFEVPDPVTPIAMAASVGPSAEAVLASSRLERLCESLQFPKNEQLMGLLHHPSDAEPTGDEMAWLEKNGAALNDAMAATHELTPDATFAAGQPRPYLRLDWLGAMLLRYGQVAERDGALDDAWRRYQAVLRLAEFARRENAVLGEVLADNLAEAAAVQLTRWGAREQQSVAELHAAIAELRRSEAEDPPLAAVVLNEYRDYVKALDDLLARPETGDPRTVFHAKWTPWEISRLRRLYRYMASLNLLDARDADAALAGHVGLGFTSSRDREFATVSRLWQTTLLGPFFETKMLAQWRCSAICYRRAAQLLLAAEGWRLQHGALPEKLSDLEGPSLKALPLDPYRNRPFEWFPSGLRVPARSYNGEELSAGTPFVYSVGPGNAARQSDAALEQFRRLPADQPIAPSPPEDSAQILDGLAFPIRIEDRSPKR